MADHIKQNPPVEKQTEDELRAEREKAERLRRFEELTDELRKAADEQGLTEELLLEQMRQTRRELYEERYGRKVTG